MKKSDREIMDILEAFDATKCAHSAAQLSGVDGKTVRRYVAARDLGRPVDGTVVRSKLIDGFMPKLEEWVERSDGRVRADVVHQRLMALGFTGSERTTRRAVHDLKESWNAGHRRTYRPWITEPGLWLQFDWGYGPLVPGPDGTPRRTLLFCAWLAWSRFRVVIPTWDRSLGTLIACLDGTLHVIGGVPTYALTDNEKTITVDLVAGVPIRHPEVVAAGRHYGLTVHSCVPFDPESKGGSEATVRIAKADLVPTDANLRPAYESFVQLADACALFMDEVNGRVHRETMRIPAHALLVEQQRLHPLPAAPFPTALGMTRTVHTDQTIRFGSVRYSTPPGFVGAEAWARVVGEELVICAKTATGLSEIARHHVSTPGNPRIDLDHYPDHPQDPTGMPRPPKTQARTLAEAEFLALGSGAQAWLIEAAAAGAQRVRTKMKDAVELASLVGVAAVDEGLGIAATAGRFAEADLLSIVTHRASGANAAALTVADEAHALQPGTSSWAGFTTGSGSGK